MLGVEPPEHLRGHKGWVGNLLERALGASAASRDQPDFDHLGIELKTLPVDRTGKVLETTFVCTIPLRELSETPWEGSRVRRKLAHVLWVPIEGQREILVAHRRVGSAFLWRPSEEQQAALRFDWEELAGIIGRGAIESLTGKLGRFLQVRPKAANAEARTLSMDAEGTLLSTLPRGFYLRTTFTQSLLEEALRGPGR